MPYTSEPKAVFENTYFTKNTTFYVFFSCCTRFLEQRHKARNSYLASYMMAGNTRNPHYHLLTSALDVETDAAIHRVK